MMLYIVTMNETEKRVDNLVKKHGWFNMEISKERIEQLKKEKKIFQLNALRSECPELFNDFEKE